MSRSEPESMAALTWGGFRLPKAFGSSRQRGEFMKTLLPTSSVAILMAVALVFVYRSFYSMRIPDNSEL